MRTQSADTRPEAEAVQVALLRAAGPLRRISLVHDLNRATRRLALAGWRRRHVHADTAQLRLWAAAQWFGEDTAAHLRGAGLVRERGEHYVTDVDPIEVVQLVTRQFDALSIPYLLGGSMAASMHGIARSTLDADIVADLTESHAAVLAQSLEVMFYVDAESIRDAVRVRGSFNLIHLESMFKIDVFVTRDRAFDRSRFARRIPLPITDDSPERIFVATAEDIVLAKLEWYCLGGGASERHWQDILGVLKVQGPAIDMVYLREWAERLRIGELLTRACEDAGLS